MAIPFLDLKEVNNHLLDEFKEQIDHLFETGQYVLGPVVQKFEDQFSRYIQTRYAMGVNSGTDAIVLALKALGIGQGDEVICPAFAPISVASAIFNCGATPVLVDVRSETGCIDPDLTLHSINQKTKAIIAVHLFGHAAEVDRMCTIARTYSVAVVEDMRHATGARQGKRRLGSYGSLACFCFYPTRTLGCIGDGGMVTTGDEKLADRVRNMRDRSCLNPNKETDLSCFDSRLDAIQAAFLQIKLQELDENNLERIENAGLYNTLLADSPVQRPPFRDDLSHVYNHYTILCPDRDKLAAHLEQKGIGTRVYYEQPLHMTSLFQALNIREGAHPVAEDLARRALSLPIYPGMKKRQIEEVAGALKEFYGVTA